MNLDEYEALFFFTDFSFSLLFKYGSLFLVRDFAPASKKKKIYVENNEFFFKP